MRWSRFLIYALLGVLLIIGAGTIFVVTLDPTDYKPQIERLIERETGRRLKIDGQIDLTLGRNAGLEVTRISFGNPGWATEPYMAKAERIAIVIDLWSLWSGPVTIEMLEIERAELNLESSSSGANNWTFAAEDDAVATADSPHQPLSLVLKQTFVSNFALNVRAPVFTEPFDLNVSSLIQSQRDDGLFDARLQGTLNERAINIAGQYGPLENLLAGQNLQIDVEGRFDTLSVAIEALIDDLTGPSKPAVEMGIQAPDVDQVTAMLGLQEFGDGPVDLRVSLQPDVQEDDTGDLQFVAKGKLAEIAVDVTGSASDLAGLERFELQFDSRGPDLGRVGATFGRNDFPPGPFDITGDIRRNGKQLEFDQLQIQVGQAKLLLDATLSEFPQIKGATVTLALQGEDIGNFTRLFGLPGKASGPFTADGRLQIDPDGVERIDLAFDTALLTLGVEGRLDPETGIDGARARVTGRSDDLATIIELFELPLSTEDALQFSGTVQFAQGAILLPEEFSVTLGRNRIFATGAVGFDLQSPLTRIRYRASGPDLADTMRLFAVDAGLPNLDFESAGELTTSSEGVSISGVNARIGDTNLEVEGLVSLREGLDGTRLQVSADGPDIGQLVPARKPEWLPQGAFRLNGSFGLRSDLVALDEVRFSVGEVEGLVNAKVGLPLDGFNVDFDAEVNGANLRRFVPRAGLYEPAELPFRLNAEGKLDNNQLLVKQSTFEYGDARISANGIFDLPPDLSETSLVISARTASLAQLGLLAGKALPDRDFLFNASFSGSPESFSVEQLTVESRDSEVTGSVVVDLQHQIPDVRVFLQSDLLDLQGFQSIEESLQEETPVSEQRVNTDRKGDKRLIPDIQLPVGQLRRLNGVVDIDIGELRQFPWRVRDLMLDINLLDGRLEVERISGSTTFGSIKGGLLIEPAETAAEWRASFQGVNILPGGTANRTPEEIENAPKYNVDIAVDSSGNDLRTVAANLNGALRVSSDSGRASNTSLRFIYGNFLEEIYTAVNPFAKTDEYTEISCIMLIAVIEQGLVDARPGAAIQTDKMNIVSGGTINLANEKLDINFRTAPRKKVSISAGEFINPYLKVSGTLESPRLTLDPTGTLVTGGAAVATAGLSILAKALWDRVVASSDPCGEIEKQAAANTDGKTKSRWKRILRLD